MNLVSHGARVTGLTPVFDVSDPLRPVGKPRDTALSQLNADLVDVGFVDEPIQCDPEVCLEVKKNYKFVERKNFSQCNQRVQLRFGESLWLGSHYGIGISMYWISVSLYHQSLVAVQIKAQWDVLTDILLKMAMGGAPDSNG